jgi:hypothetical protein
MATITFVLQLFSESIMIYMRIIVFLDGGLGKVFPSPFPGMRYEAAIGTGFGLPRGNKFSIGTSGVGQFIQAQILPGANWQGTFTYLWRNEYVFDLSDQMPNRQIFFGLQYRFNHKN